ncbi:MAG: diacylglycerol kinase family protein [Prosthecochloris sp.]|nr:diacylglycerol kinase family protein [Prosthecochloris sp.]
MSEKRRLILVVNPAADRGRSARRVARLLEEASMADDVQVFLTAHAGHAGELAAMGARQGAAVIACGGDGTAHEIAGALVSTGGIMGVLAAGSANDLVKSYHAPQVGKLASSDVFAADLGCVRRAGSTGERCFINSLGIGLTGRIALRVSRSHLLKGDVRYAAALLRELLGYTAVNMHITLTTPQGVEEIDEPVFAFSVANGRVEGGRFCIGPRASLTDGLLDVCILRSIPPLSFLRYSMKYMKGSQVADPMVVYRQVSAVELEFHQPQVMHMDGEVYGDVSGRIRIDALCGAVNLLGRP